MIKQFGKALQSFGEGLAGKSATMYKGAKYTVNSKGQKTARMGGTMTAKGQLYRGAGRAFEEMGKRPYLTTGVIAASGVSAAVGGRSSGANGLSGRSSGANGLSGRSSGAY
jgi:hypothetical protein